MRTTVGVCSVTTSLKTFLTSCISNGRHAGLRVPHGGCGSEKQANECRYAVAFLLTMDGDVLRFEVFRLESLCPATRHGCASCSPGPVIPPLLFLFLTHAVWNSHRRWVVSYDAYNTTITLQRKRFSLDPSRSTLALYILARNKA